jgi:hypothetical protein
MVDGGLKELAQDKCQMVEFSTNKTEPERPYYTVLVSDTR